MYVQMVKEAWFDKGKQEIAGPYAAQIFQWAVVRVPF